MIIEVSEKTKKYIDEIRESGDEELILAYHIWMSESIGFEQRSENDEAFQEIKSKAHKSVKEVVLALVKNELRLTTKPKELIFYKNVGDGRTFYYSNFINSNSKESAAVFIIGLDDEKIEAMKTLGWNEQVIK